MKPTQSLTLAPALTPEALASVKLRIAEACSWLRLHAPGRALEVLESLQTQLEKDEHGKRNP